MGRAARDDRLPRALTPNFPARSGNLQLGTGTLGCRAEGRRHGRESWDEAAAYRGVDGALPTRRRFLRWPGERPPSRDLARLRSSIDNIDAALVHLLAERFKCTQAVGELKAAAGLPPADPAREEEQVARLRALADEAGLDPQFAEAFLAFIIAEVIRHHEHIAGAEPGA